MRKIVKTKSLNSTLIFILITSLVWFSDDSLLDTLTLPKIAVFSTLSLIFIFLNFTQIRRYVLTCSWPIRIVVLFSIPGLVGIPYTDTFYGESQRINGTLQLILIASSIVIGFLCAKYHLLQALKNTIVLNGTAVSTLIVFSLFTTLDSPIFVQWTMRNQQGGINENFKSMFVALSLLMLQLKLKSRRRDSIKLFCYVAATFMHVIALILNGSLQGFLLIALAGLFLACASRPKFRIGIPIFASVFIIMYLSVLFLSPLTQYAESSTRERINLAKRAIGILQEAPLIRPNVIRISENDFSDVTLTKLAESEVWIDDVHNVYLNLGNTIGIFFLMGLIISLTFYIIDYTKNIQSLTESARRLGAIILATVLVLFITILNPIYFLPLSMMIGAYLYLREQNLKKTSVSQEGDSISKTLLFNVSRSRIGLVISAMLVLQLTFGTLFILREYSTQKDVNRIMFMNSSRGNSSLAGNFEYLLPLLERSRDFRFVYEVGRSFYLQGNCAETGKIEMILHKRSSRHFLTKKLGSLYDECVAR